MKVGIPYKLKVSGHFKGTPWWSEHCHRHTGTQKQILHDYYLHDLIQGRFLLFLFSLTRAMRCFFSFNCPLHHLQCILSKDTAGKVRWCFHCRSYIFTLYQNAFEELAVQKGLMVAWFQLWQFPFRPCTPPPLEMISLGCKLHVQWGSLLAVQQNGHSPMTISPQHKQRVDQGLEFNEEDKSWSANKDLKFERKNFREATWTEELSDMADICNSFQTEILRLSGYVRKHPGICRKELHTQQTNVTFTTIFKIDKQPKNCRK